MAVLKKSPLNQMRDSTGREIARGLPGKKVQVESPPADAPISGLRQFHIEAGNQNFYSLPASANPQAAQTVAFIDQLLALTSNPAAITALQSARASLASTSGK